MLISRISRRISSGTFGRLGTVFEQHRAVNLLDVDAAFLFGLDRVCDLEQLPHRRFWIGVGAGFNELHSCLMCRS
jgi:hypothetical protein